MIIRALPFITSEDKPEFIGYATAWFEFVKSHHDDEETNLFPQVAALLGKPGIWEETYKEHGEQASKILDLR